MAMKKIAIVEDDPLLGRALVDKLGMEGFETVLIPDGAEALAQIQQTQPDLILLDIMLPHVDGFGILKALKADATLQAVPVIMLTNLGQESDQTLGSELGAVEYLIKSDHMLAEIVSIIHKHI
jgi:DNA-binding response OmpR family regulator